jgi:hypothetical protein
MLQLVLQSFAAGCAELFGLLWFLRVALLL